MTILRKILVTTLVAVVLPLMPRSAAAAPIIFFGEDLGGGEAVFLAATPNADAAQASFLAGLLTPGVETFESRSGGSPLAINFANGVTATLTGSGTVTALANGITNGAGRFGVTGDGGNDERYWDSGGGLNAFTINFSTPVAAFGFFGIDIGDFNGQVTATTAGGLNQIFNVGNSTSISGGSVLFWGVIDPSASFTSVAFGNTGSGADVFGFDDFTVGTPQQINPRNPVPEPTTVVLLGGGLAVVAVLRRRRAR